MALPIIPKPAYPDVPREPGVPVIPRRVGAVQNSIVTATADVLQVIGLFLGPQWGLFDANGAPAFSGIGGGILGGLLSLAGIGGQSIVGVEFRNDSRLSTAPQEQGAFLSYNKVASPFNARVTYAVGGAEAMRTAFLQAVQDAQDSLDLFDLIMPEFTYPDCCVTHHDFRRTSRSGVSLLQVDIWVEEVRIVSQAEYTSTAAPSGAAPVNGGTVQSMTPTSVQSSGLPAGAVT